MLTPSARIDITREVCPMTYVRVKLKLEALSPGEVLEVVLRGKEPLKNVPRNAQEEGYLLVSLEADGDAHRLLLQKPPSPG